jgi:hypothetical protein
MESNRSRMIQIAVLVTGFAVGMAGLLNYFKYKAVADRIVTERLTFTGKQIENSIQSSLALGLQFSELGTLPSTLQRLRATDDLILGIKIFDAEGQPLYSTDQLRARQRVPDAWLERSQRAGTEVWVVRDERDAAVGMAVQNQFGLTLGHVAMRYSQAQVEEAALQVGKQLALLTLGVFVVAAALASFLMMVVMNRLARDAKLLEHALRSGDPTRAAAAGRGGPFAQALRRFVETVRSAESQIIELRGQLHRGGEPR